MRAILINANDSQHYSIFMTHPALRPLRLAAWLAFCSSALAHAAPSPDSAPPQENTLPAVRVTAAPDAPQHLREDVSSGALGTRSQLDTPFSTTIVDAKELAERQPFKLAEVFGGDASVTDNGNGYSVWASYLSVRGLQLDWQNGYKIDGLPFVSYGITMPYEQLERVELLKGLGGFMYGFASPGGVINYVTKKPTAQPVASVDVGYRSTGVWSEHVDLGRRFGPDQMFGARLNATHEEGKIYNGGNVRRDTASLALDANLTRDLSVNFGALYQNRRTSGQTPSIYTGSYTGASLPSAISGGTSNLAGADQYLATNLQQYTFGVQYQLTPDWVASATYSYSKVTRQRNESTLYLLDGAGNYTDTRYAGNQGHRFSLWQAMLEGKVRTGPFSHQLVFGAAWQKETSDYSSNDLYRSIGTGNLYAPNPNALYNPGGFTQYRDNDITQKSLFASDTVKLTERWSVIAGLRYISYEQNSYSPAGATLSTYADNGVITPTFALLYKLAPSTTLYASYVESLEPGQRVGDTYANHGELLKALRSKQYEVGVKSEHARWSATAALFRIERGAAYANSANVYVQDGQSIYQGVELAASAKLGAQWEVAGSLMALDSWYAKGAANNGNRVAGAPTFVAAGKLAYAVPTLPGLTLGAQAKFTGNTPLRAAGGLNAPGYLLVGLGATYATRVGGHGVTLRASLDNLTNRRYWQYQYENYVMPGDPRTISVNAKFDF